MMIRVLKKDELALLYSYSQKEGWDTEEIHTNSLYAAHPNDFFIAYENEELIGFILAVKHNNKFGLISNLLVLKEFRRRGYGKTLLEFGVEYLENRQIALDSIKGKEAFYETIGFRAYFDTITYKFLIGNVLLPNNNIEIVDFDRRLCF